MDGLQIMVHMVKKLEKRLAEYLGVKNIVLVANGTVALEIAYRTLGLKGFAITTPFSFVATTSSLVTNNFYQSLQILIQIH